MKDSWHRLIGQRHAFLFGRMSRVFAVFGLEQFWFWCCCQWNMGSDAQVNVGVAAYSCTEFVLCGLVGWRFVVFESFEVDVRTWTLSACWMQPVGL